MVELRLNFIIMIVFVQKGCKTAIHLTGFVWCFQCKKGHWIFHEPTRSVCINTWRFWIHTNSDWFAVSRFLPIRMETKNRTKGTLGKQWMHATYWLKSLVCDCDEAASEILSLLPIDRSIKTTPMPKITQNQNNTRCQTECTDSSNIVITEVLKIPWGTELGLWSPLNTER